MVKKSVLSALFANLCAVSLFAPIIVEAKNINPINTINSSIKLNKISNEAAAIDYDNAMQIYTNEIQKSKNIVTNKAPQVSAKFVNNKIETKTLVSNARYGKLTTTIEQNSQTTYEKTAKYTENKPVYKSEVREVSQPKPIVKSIEPAKSFANTVKKPVATQKQQTNSEAQAQVKTDTNSNLTYAEIQLARELGLKINEKTSDVRPDDVADYQKIGSPYQANGVWYIPAHEPDYRETGKASWYGEGFNGKRTANGEIFDMNQVSVAHPTLPLSSLVQVTNLDNGRSIVARVNDRGPFVGNRLIDVSKRGAELLGFKEKGSANVRVTYVGQANDAPKPIAPKTILVMNKPNAQVLNKSTINPIKNNNSNMVLVSNDINTSPVKYSYQIGAFANKNNAERALSNMALGKGVIITTENNGTILYRVMTTKPVDTEAASTMQIAAK